MTRTTDEHEQNLVARAREGDQAAFGALCAQYEDRLRRRVELRMSRGVQRRVAASDVLQIAHLEAYGKMASFEDRGPGSFGRWLARIVDLKAKEMVRHHAGTAKRDVAAEVTRASRGTMDGVRGAGASPSQVAIGAELRDAARQAVERLPENYRTVIELIQGAGLSTAEAAERLGKTRDVVKGLYSRALARLARELNLNGSRE